MKISFSNVINNRMQHLEERIALLEKAKRSLIIQGPISFSVADIVEENGVSIVPESISPYSQLPYNDFVFQALPMQYYQNMVLYDTKDAYDLLNDDYKNKRFGSYNSFEEYVNDYNQTIEN